MRYVDAFVVPIARRQVAKYQKIARAAGRIWREHGALAYIEATGDDLSPAEVKVTFPKLARSKPGETVIVAFIVYKSRAHRDRVNKKVFEDPRMNRMIEGMTMPFDMRRMAYGGFSAIVDL
ncbi:MAG TPA: DUF1428 domain-containing protein [Gemmatimonadales bacterium]